MLKSFDIRKDNQTIGEGGFFCRACAVGKPAAEISPDSRYCRECYLVLREEAGMVKEKKANWAPRRASQISLL